MRQTRFEPSEFVLTSFFGRSDPFLASVIKDRKAKHLQNIASGLRAKEEAAKNARAEAIKNTNIDKAVAHTVEASRKKAATAKARATITAKQSARAEKRKISLVN